VVRGPASPEPGRTLSEHASKTLLASYGIPSARERLASDPKAAVAAAEAIGFPVAVKLCGDAIAHKTERDLVRLGLADAQAVRRASQELLAKRRPEDGKTELLVCEMVRGRRELIAGFVRDPQFGACVVLVDKRRLPPHWLMCDRASATPTPKQCPRLNNAMSREHRDDDYHAPPQ